MKISYLILFAFALLILGCVRETKSSQASPGKSMTVSNGDFTWKLGTLMINGTNVPMSNITVQVVQETNGTP